MPNPLCIQKLLFVTQLQANSDTYLHLSFFYNAGVVIVITTSKPNFHVDVRPKYAIYTNAIVGGPKGRPTNVNFITATVRLCHYFKTNPPPTSFRGGEPFCVRGPKTFMENIQGPQIKKRSFMAAVLNLFFVSAPPNGYTKTSAMHRRPSHSTDVAYILSAYITVAKYTGGPFDNVTRAASVPRAAL